MSLEAVETFTRRFGVQGNSSRLGDVPSQAERREIARTTLILIGVFPVFFVVTLIKSLGYPVHCVVQNLQTVA